MRAIVLIRPGPYSTANGALQGKTVAIQLGRIARHESNLAEPKGPARRCNGFNPARAQTRRPARLGAREAARRPPGRQAPAPRRPAPARGDRTRARPAAAQLSPGSRRAAPLPELGRAAS